MSVNCYSIFVLPIYASIVLQSSAMTNLLFEWVCYYSFVMQRMMINNDIHCRMHNICVCLYNYVRFMHTHTHTQQPPSSCSYGGPCFNLLLFKPVLHFLHLLFCLCSLIRDFLMQQFSSPLIFTVQFDWMRKWRFNRHFYIQVLTLIVKDWLMFTQVISLCWCLC